MEIQVETISFNPKLKGEVVILQGHTNDGDLINNKFVVSEVESNILVVNPLWNLSVKYHIHKEDLETLNITHVPIEFDEKLILEESK